MPPRTFRKVGPAAPAGYFPWEAAGLRWLAATRDGATGRDGVAVVPVVHVTDDYLELVRLPDLVPTQAMAEAFGADLAATHAAGSAAYGAPPEGWFGDGWLGPMTELLPLALHPVDTWGELWAHQRLVPMLEEGRRRGIYDSADTVLFERVAARVASGELDTGEPAARLHGDLWGGNIMWGPEGAVLIDPAAHGGHRETDLGMLTLMGAPRLATILAAYDETAPLVDGWRERQSLHQLHPLMLHAIVYGGGYVEQSRVAARPWA